jgi:hypothetical protein
MLIDNMNTQLVEAISQIIQRLKPEERELLEVKLNSISPSQVGERVVDLSTEEWLLSFQDWVDSHRNLQLPTLADDDISRESIYGERG